MAVVEMFIEKFGGVVKIDDDHPLAIAQRAKDAAAPAAEGGDPRSEVKDSSGGRDDGPPMANPKRKRKVR